jgi:hypothetical protein
MRQRLLNRRASTSFDLEVAGLRYTATISHFFDGRIGELFLSNHKSTRPPTLTRAMRQSFSASQARRAPRPRSDPPCPVPR